MKKEYIKPDMKVVLLQHYTQLLQSSIRSLSTNMDDDDDDFIWGGGGNGPAR